MTIEETSIIIGNIPINGDECYPISEYQQAKARAIEALEQNEKLKEAIKEIDKWVHSGNRGNCDYFIVDQVEEIINGLKKDGTVSE